MELPPAPDSLIEHALLILKTPNAILKTRLTLRMAELWNSNRIPFIIPDKLNSYNTILAQIPSLPPRDDIEIVNVFETSRRGKGGSLQSRIVMLHSLAGVEQWAIDLACDVVVRFAGSKIRGLPVGEEEDIVEEDGEMMDGMKKCKFCRGGYKLVKTLEEGEVVVDDEARVRVELERGFFDDFVRIASEEAKVRLLHSFPFILLILILTTQQTALHIPQRPSRSPRQFLRRPPNPFLTLELSNRNLLLPSLPSRNRQHGPRSPRVRRQPTHHHPIRQRRRRSLPRKTPVNP